MFSDIWKYRSYIITNSWTDIKERYAGSSLGSFWAILNPLFQILIFTFVFSQIMVMKVSGLESGATFSIYLCAGLIPWWAFSEIVTRGCSCFLENATYLKKLPIPEHIFVIRLVVSSSLNLAISMILLFIITLLLGHPISIHWFSLLFLLPFFQLFGYGLALIVSTITVFIRDIQQILNTLIQMWMWLTPIVYLEEIIPEKFQHFLYYNPVYWFIDAIHTVIVFNKGITLQSYVITSCIAVITFIIGYFTLNKLRTEIRDVI